MGEWEIFGAEVFLCYSQFFVNSDFIIDRVECMYYAFGNHIYFFSSMTTYIFSVLPSYIHTGNYDSFAMVILSQIHRGIDIAESVLVSIKV